MPIDSEPNDPPPHPISKGFAADSESFDHSKSSASPPIEIPRGPEFEARLGDVLGAWIERRDSGVGELPEDFVKAHPELAPELSECMESLELLTCSGLASEPHRKSTYPEIPDFRITGQLGRGGMGIVYEATQVSLDRPVALKVLPAVTTSPIAARRFRREAATAAALHHTHIVPIYAVGHDDGVHWYAMQRIDGKPLNEVVAGESGGIKIDEVVQIGIESAEALAFAHEHGVVHRDIKPANLLMEQGGHIWLADFGLARRDADLGATATGAMLGTPRYMSPEQVFAPAGATLDYRSDIYSLGATLYELVTGRVLFDGPTPLDVLQQIRTAEPAKPSSVRRDCPRDLEIVLQKCLAKDVKERYQSAGDLASDLRAIQDGRPIKARGVPIWTRVRRRIARDGERWKTAAMVAGLTIATLLGGYAVQQRSQDAREGSVRITASGGPFVASIYAAGTCVSQDPTVTTSLPMQEPLVFDQGSYLVRLEQPGKPSTVSRFDVDAAELTRAHHVDRKKSSAGISAPMHCYLDVVRDSDGRERLARVDRESIALFEPNEELVWMVDASITPTAEPITWEHATGATDDKNADDTSTSEASDSVGNTNQTERLAIDFRHEPADGWSGNPDAIEPYYARPRRVMRQSVDLDGDQQGDWIVSGRKRGALAAVSARGEVLWARRIQSPSESETIAKGKQGGPNLSRQGLSKPKVTSPDPIPFVMEVLPIDDVDGDSVDDLVVNYSELEGPVTSPSLLTLSGRTGDLIARAPLEKIDVLGKPRLWPMDGTLVHRTMGISLREFRGIDSITQGRLRRSAVTWDYPLRWRNTSRLSNLPVTPPLHRVRWKGRQVLVSVTDVSFSIWDPATGKAIGDLVKVPFSIACRPLVVDLGDGQTGLWFWSSSVSGNGDSNSRQVGVWALGEKEPRWIQPIQFRWELMSAGLERSDLPLAEDLDGDGCDEVLIPSCNVQKWASDGSLQCFDARTGNAKWNRSPRFRSLEWMPERATVLRDFDGDGVRDVGVLTLWGAESFDPTWGSTSKKQEFALYVDLLSGKDGKTIGFRKESFAAPELDKHVDIDCVCSDGDSRVEASVVITQMDGIELESRSIRFDFMEPGPATVIPGLARIGHSKLVTEFGFYRRRSGIDQIESDAVIGLATSTQTMHRLDADRLLASWTSEDGHGRLLLSDSKHRRLRAVDASTGLTLWSRRYDPGSVRAIPVTKRDGNANALLLQTFLSRPSTPTLIDAESGRVLWTAPISFGKSIRSFWADDAQTSLWWLTHASYVDAGNQNSAERGVMVCRISREGELLSQQRVLTGLSPNLGENHFSIAALNIDLDGDGVRDLLVPDDGEDTEVALNAISGVDGRSIWKHDLRLPVRAWTSEVAWPVMSVLGDAKDRRVVVADIDGREAFALKMLSGETGQVVDRCSLPIHSPIGRFRGYVSGPLRLSIQTHESATEGNDVWPTLDVAFPVRHGSTKEWTRGWIQIDTQASGFTNKSEPSLQPSGRDFWFTAVPRAGMASRRYKCSDDKLQCETANDVVWSVDASHWGRLRGVTQSRDGMVAIAMFRNEQGEDLFVELFAGTVVWKGDAADRDSNSRVSPTELSPLLLRDHGSWRVVQSNRRGVHVAELAATSHLEGSDVADHDAGSAQATSIWGDATEDDRLRRALPVVAAQSPTESLGAMIAAAFQAFAAVVLPLLYLHRLFRRRTFQLWYLLLAPAVALFSILTWQHLLDPSRLASSNLNQNEPWPLILFGGTMSIVACALLYRWVRDRHFIILGVVFLLSVLMTMMMIGLPLLSQWIQKDSVQYHVGLWDVVWMFVIQCLSLSVILLPAWALARVLRRRIFPTVGQMHVATVVSKGE